MRLAFIFFLSQYCFRDVEFYRRRFLGFLDKAMQHHNSLSHYRAKEHTSIIWRLWKTENMKRTLFLGDRNILAD
jgi:hypothetical protein